MVRIFIWNSDGKLVSATLNGKGGFFFSESVGLFHATVKAVQGSYRLDYYTSQVSAVLERSGIVSMKDDFDIDFGEIWSVESDYSDSIFGFPRITCSCWSCNDYPQAFFIAQRKVVGLPEKLRLF